MYKLKPNVPDFEMVDGPFEGRKYEAGEVYREVPPDKLSLFAVVEDVEAIEG